MPTKEGEGFFPFEERVARAFGPVEPGTVVVAAVSGGADSTALLAAASRLRVRLRYDLRCVHVDHGIRPAPERSGDRSAVEALCRSLAVPFASVGPPELSILDRARSTGRGIEAAARSYRRAALLAEARRLGAPLILLGHTRDDARETALMRVLRGSGPSGLGGIAARRGRFLRPMLDLGRTDVLSYLAALGIPYRTDSTNADTAYLRNRIRSRLIPLLEAEFPFWRSGLDAFCRIQQGTADVLASESRRRVRWTGAPGGSALSTPADPFFNAPRLLREEAVFRAVDILVSRSRRLRRPGELPPADGPRRPEPSRAAVSRFCGGDLKAADLGSVRLRREGADVVAELVGRDEERGYSFVVRAPGSFEFRGLAFRVGSADESGPDAQSFPILLPCAVRSVLPSDAVRASGNRLRGARRLASDARGAGDRSVPFATVADADGVAAVILRGAGSDTVHISIERKERETYYARRLFFSIL